MELMSAIARIPKMMNPIEEMKKNISDCIRAVIAPVMTETPGLNRASLENSSERGQCR